MISFNGSATDFTDLGLSKSALSWRIEFAQDGITNVVFGPVAGITSGSYNIPTNANGGTYQIILIATDSTGRKGTNVATLSPANPPSGWSSYYPFKANANDANGHSGFRMPNRSPTHSMPIEEFMVATRHQP